MLTRTCPKASWIHLVLRIPLLLKCRKKKEGEAVVISVPAVMAQIELIGFGNLPEADWGNLVKFRIFIPKEMAAMMIDCLFQFCNGRIKSSTVNYATRAGLHPKGMAWSKLFILIELYSRGLPAEDKNPSAAMSQPD